MSLIFCNIGWMERYEGLDSGDEISGGGSYVSREGRGHEICNFSDQHGTLFGYVQPSGQQIDINRLGASPGDDSIDHVTVIWTATRPTGGTTIVGWYERATVYRSYQRHQALPAPQALNRIDGYWTRAKRDDARLLPVDARTFDIPRQVKGGMGQSNVWYADAPEAAGVVRSVLDYVRLGQLPSSKSSRTGNQDQERKALVEQVAIQTCSRHYEALGYTVESVEGDNIGWDLEAGVGRLLLRIEVKGLSGTSAAIELTPNEFDAFSRQSPDYRLAVVVAALDAPTLLICRFSAEQNRWVVEGESGRFIEIVVRQSASIRCI